MYSPSIQWLAVTAELAHVIIELAAYRAPVPGEISGGDGDAYTAPVPGESGGGEGGCEHTAGRRSLVQVESDHKPLEERCLTESEPPLQQDSQVPQLLGLPESHAE